MPCFSFSRQRLVPETNHRHFSLSDLDSATSGFSTLLGRGSHGSVYLASFNNPRLLAAVKLHHHSSNEISILSSLPSSPFIVNLLGSVPSHQISVTQFMPRGSLHNLLHPPLPLSPPPFRLRLQLALRTAQALQSIHALHPPVLHRDIKPSNILLDSDGRPRLSDFGLAVRGLPSAASPAGTIGYLDPAYVNPADLSVKTDVYSFGVVLLELMSGRRAIDVEYGTVSVVKWTAGIVGEGRFGEMWDRRGGGPGCGEEEVAGVEVVRVAVRCVGVEPEGRPEMEEVVRLLRAAEWIAGSSPEKKAFPVSRRGLRFW